MRYNRMKSTVLIAVVGFLLASTSALAQLGEVRIQLSAGPLYVDSTNSLDYGVIMDAPYRYTVQAKSTTMQESATLGFIIYSPDGSLSTINYLDAFEMASDWASNTEYWTLTGGLLTTDADGTLPDQVLTGGQYYPPAGGGFLEPDYVDVLTWMIETPIQEGVLCVDSAYHHPSGDWLMYPSGPPVWHGGGGDVAVGGTRTSAFCVTIFEPQYSPTCLNPGQAAISDACNPVLLNMSMSDPDGPSTLTYEVSHDGFGNAVVSSAGIMTYTPDPADRGNTVNVVVTGTDGDGLTGECNATIDITNSKPVVTCPPNSGFIGGIPMTTQPGSVTDADECDSTFLWSIVSVQPALLGTYSVNPATGAFSLYPDDQDGLFEGIEVCLEASDGNKSDTCCFDLHRLSIEPFAVTITDTVATYLTGPVDVMVELSGGGIFDVGGFDFSIAYDNTFLNLISINPGSIYDDYEWEYFNYWLPEPGHCVINCEHNGIVKLSGLAELNNGSHQALSTSLIPGDDFLRMKFAVSGDWRAECTFQSIHWYWESCSDNILRSKYGDTAFISSKLYPYYGDTSIADTTKSFPTQLGAPLECSIDSSEGIPIRLVDFRMGGIEIVCNDSVAHPRGDLNLNNYRYEISDAILFIEYFKNGPSVLGPDLEYVEYASDANANNIPLEVSDLVKMLRVISGQDLPAFKYEASQNIANVNMSDRIISTDTELGAALFVFEGEANVTLLAKNMQLSVGMVDGNTQALVYSLDGELIAPGDVIESEGELLSVEASDVYGVTLSVSLELPRVFAVHQNYPNPFNPSTKIRFDVPTATEYTVSIYNMSGQKVVEISGEASAGRNEVVWNASEFASGVYLYKVTAGVNSQSRKMVLLK